MKKIVFGITDLNIGGAETVLVDLVNKLSDNYNIAVFTLYPNGELENRLNKNIKILSCYNKPFNEYSSLMKKKISFEQFFFKKYFYKKFIKNKFDVEIAFLEGPITSLFSVPDRTTKKIAWVHTDISLIFGNGLKSKIKKLVNKKIYNAYTDLIFVSQGALNKFNKTYRVNAKKQVINNYIDSNRIIELSKEKIDFAFDKNTINFLSVCRLVPSKAIDRLIKIHSKLINDGFYHKIYIIGEGPERENLEQLIKSNNVENTFILLGKKENPYPYIKQCDYFCLLSHYEGYGMVLDEAKIFSKKIIATDNASAEALKDYNNKAITGNNKDSIYNCFQNIITQNKSLKNTSLGELPHHINKNDIIIKKIIEIIGE